MIALLIAAVSLTPQATVVDLVEVKHYHNETGKHVLDQLIFYSWSPQLKRYDVRGWRIIACESMYPVRRGDGYVVRWHDDGVMREIFAKAKRETVTKHDPELRQRERLPESDRKPLFVKVEE